MGDYGASFSRGTAPGICLINKFDWDSGLAPVACGLWVAGCGSKGFRIPSSTGGGCGLFIDVCFQRNGFKCIFQVLLIISNGSNNFAGMRSQVTGAKVWPTRANPMP